MRNWQPYAVLLATFAFAIAYARPGVCGVDALYQLWQARSHQYGNWHPPLMTGIWTVLDAIVSGPLLMLVLQVGLFIGGVYLVLRTRFEPLRAAVLAACIALFPPVFAMLGSICKDVLMAGFLACGAAALHRKHWSAWPLLLAAAGIRHNAPIMIIPLVAMLFPYAAGWRRYVVGAALGLAVSLAGMLIDRAFVQVDEHPLANMLALGDSAGVVAKAPPMTDDEVRSLLDGVALRGDHLQARIAATHPEWHGWEAVALGDDRVFDLATTDDQASALLHAWPRAIAAHPGAYMTHRWSMFRRVTGIPWFRTVGFSTPLSEDPAALAQMGEVHSPDAFQRGYARFLLWLGGSVLFSPMLYLLLGAGLVYVFRRDELVRALLVGGLLYELALLPLQTGGRELRYSHWMITCVAIAIAVRLSAAFAAKHQAAEREAR